MVGYEIDFLYVRGLTISVFHLNRWVTTQVLEYFGFDLFDLALFLALFGRPPLRHILRLYSYSFRLLHIINDLNI